MGHQCVIANIGEIHTSKSTMKFIQPVVLNQMKIKKNTLYLEMGKGYHCYIIFPRVFVGYPNQLKAISYF
jgi:hypothetical protein